MNGMNDQRFHDLAMKVIARQATADERVELDSALADDPRLKEELDRLRASAFVAKEVLPLVDATESTAGDPPAYARQRLQTKVRETLGRPSVAEQKRPWAWRWFLVLAPVTAALVCLVVVLTRPKAPMIQIAMLDTAGPTRGAGTNGVTLLQEQWRQAEVRTFQKAEDLDSWAKDWPPTKGPAVKVVFDPAAAEVRLLIRSKEKLVQKTVPVDQDLSTALRQAEAFIKERLGH